tara:strand:- start:1800 stop:3845 length:2046 start_codon:yes stop_codon:yes gene_type:complete
MPDLLLEIFCEDLPPNSQIEGEKKLQSVFETFLKIQNISFANIKILTTSRRFFIFISNLPEKKKKVLKSIRGPMVNSKETAVLGFLKSNNILKKNLMIKNVNDKEYYFYEKEVPEQSVFDIFQSSIPILLKEVKWRKSMRWSSLSEKWARPIKSIFCIFNRKVVIFSFAGINSNNVIYGNYVLNNNHVKCKTFLDYNIFLKKNNVILEQENREKIIKSKLKIICKKYDLYFEPDDKLISENSRLVENPNIMYGRFDKEFFTMPENFIISIVSGQQKYFSFKDNKGNLSNLFAFVTNHKIDKTNQIKKGHERLLRARFNDALFFIKEDSKIKLVDRIKMLEEIIYFEKLGNLRQKSNRISKISKYVGKLMNFTFTKEQDLISSFCLCDLTTEMVNEFPNLQGYVGNFYANKEGFSKKSSLALIEQYRPGFNEKVPTLIFSICLAVAEKIDKIISTFLSNKKPSGSKDPYGIRRASLGLIRILIDNKIDIELNDLIYKSLSFFKFEKKKDNLTILEIRNFINTRLFIYMKELGFREDIINSFLNRNVLNPFQIFKNCKLLSNFLKSNNGIKFIISFHRLNSFVDKSKKSTTKINKQFLIVKEEKNLLKKVLNIKEKFENSNGFESYLSNLTSLTNPINLFFEKVKVNCDENNISDNRYNLLKFSREIIESKCLFSLLKKNNDE